MKDELIIEIMEKFEEDCKLNKAKWDKHFAQLMRLF